MGKLQNRNQTRIPIRIRVPNRGSGGNASISWDVWAQSESGSAYFHPRATRRHTHVCVNNKTRVATAQGIESWEKGATFAGCLCRVRVKVPQVAFPLESWCENEGLKWTPSGSLTCHGGKIFERKESQKVSANDEDQHRGGLPHRLCAVHSGAGGEVTPTKTKKTIFVLYIWKIYSYILG